MPKTLVAMVPTEKRDGLRTYSLFNRNGQVLTKITVADCGQGAASATEVATRRGFALSSADWAFELARQFAV